jgi:hypothetical protein
MRLPHNERPKHFKYSGRRYLSARGRRNRKRMMREIERRVPMKWRLAA